MMFASTTNLSRKSGVAQWRDLRFSFVPLIWTALTVFRLGQIMRANLQDYDGVYRCETSKVYEQITAAEFHRRLNSS
jgi:hypothetical protein